jgi:hypothetical protein
MPPLWTHIKVPPYRDWSNVGVEVGEAVGVEVEVGVVAVGDADGEPVGVVAVGVGVGLGLPQLLINNPTRRMNTRAKYTNFFVTWPPSNDLQ